ncbi:hypothetical protein ACWD7F_25470 [Streptomyces sp. NPDC005122]
MLTTITGAEDDPASLTYWRSREPVLSPGSGSLASRSTETRAWICASLVMF